LLAAVLFHLHVMPIHQADHTKIWVLTTFLHFFIAEILAHFYHLAPCFSEGKENCLCFIGLLKERVEMWNVTVGAFPLMPSH
jgi:hypothetical protein